MKVGSLFTGIGGFDLAFQKVGMEIAWQVEIDKWCNYVLQKHWPDVKRYKNIEEFTDYGTIDLICGGFPCQDLSVAGQREGLSGKRSGLWWEFYRVLREARPSWTLIENVPGLLSSNGGKDMGTLLRALGDIGYRWAYRVLDSQYFGVAQRRRRVFIVGHLGDGCAAEVLFEPESSRRNLTESQKSGEETPPDFISSTFKRSTEGWANPNGISGAVSKVWAKQKGGPAGDECYHLTIPPGAMAISENQRAEVRLTPYSRQITGGGGKPGQGYPAVLHFTFADGRNNVPFAGVRRLTPIECERLQGFPDMWTGVVEKLTKNLEPDEIDYWRYHYHRIYDKHLTDDGVRRIISDTQRYKQLGNAVTVNVVQWIGKRIMEVNELG